MMSLLPEVSARMVGFSGLVVTIVGDSLVTGSGEAVASGGSDGGSLAAVFLVGGDVADAGLQPDRVVVLASDLQFST